jgi:hypothetical protein
MTRRLSPWAAAVLVAQSCTIAPAQGDGALAAVGSLPSGYGTLRQEEISISLNSGDLRLMVTPLHASVVRVTAPDTEQRLEGVREAHRDPSVPEEAHFLVSFYSEQPDVRFVPEEVQLISRGLRLRPASVSPVTPGWGQRRVPQRSTEMAVYAFAGTVDLESDLALVYGLQQNRSWTATILPRIQAERARVRARAGTRRSSVR